MPASPLASHLSSPSNVSRAKSDHTCTYTPELMYLLIAIIEASSPEEATSTSPEEATSNAPHPYVKLSKRYANVFLKCDGRSQTPKTYRDTLQDAVFSTSENLSVKQHTITKFGIYSKLLLFTVRPAIRAAPLTILASQICMSC